MHNHVSLIGKLGRPPNSFTMATGSVGAFLSVATTEPGGENKTTQWHTIIVYDKLAEQCIKYLTTGRLVHVVGSLLYTQKEKDGVKYMEARIKAKEVTFLDAPGSGAKKQEESNLTIPSSPLPPFLASSSTVTSEVLRYTEDGPKNTSSMYGYRPTYIEHTVEQELKFSDS